MAVKPAHILGINARYQYTKMNPGAAKQYGFSKLKTKELLRANHIPTPEVYHSFNNHDDLTDIRWETMPVPFVIKPVSGSAGKGIWVIKEKIAEKMLWKDSDNELVTEEDLSLHVRNILDGEFTTWGSNNQALVEEMIPVHPSLARFTYRGTPDIRVIVFNSVPVMAMTRIPTKDSHGRANLDQGALGLGIDLATGITINGVRGKSEIITHFPGLKKKVNGVLIPHWTNVLEISVRSANVAGYMFMGADLFIHPEKGPMIVEINGFPGLSIQLANRAGLKRRIDRVEGLDVRNAQHGVKISQALFAENFGDEIKAEEGLQIISFEQTVGVYAENRKLHSTEALVNTGRSRSAISEEFAEELELLDIEDLLWQQQEGIEGKVPVIEVEIKIKNRRIKTAMTVSKKLNRTKHKIELGRHDLQGFLVGENNT